MRPAAHEWDEREETPWPIIEEAAHIGLYSFDFVANMFSDPTGISVPMVMEEMAWGDAGIGLAIFGTTLGVAGIFGNGTPEQVAEWVPQCFGTPDKIALAAFCVSEPDAGSDVSSMRTGAVYDEARDEWVLNGTKTWITNGGIADIHVVVASVDPELRGAGPGQLHRAPRDQGPVAWARSSRRWASGRPIPPRSILDDVRVPGRLLLGGKEKLDERLARARAGQTGQRRQAALSTFETTRPAVGAQAVGIARAAYEYALEYAKERHQFGRAIIENQAIAFKLAEMRMHTDAARLLVWNASWRGASGHGYRGGGGLAVEAVRRRDGRAGDRRSHPDHWAGRAIYATTRWSDGTVTPRSSPSSRARARYSTW